MQGFCHSGPRDTPKTLVYIKNFGRVKFLQNELFQYSVVFISLVVLLSLVFTFFFSYLDLTT